MRRYDIYGHGYQTTEELREDGDWVKYEDVIDAIEDAVLAEREECAKLAEKTYEGSGRSGYEDESGYDFYGERSAEAIRERSRKKA